MSGRAGNRRTPPKSPKVTYEALLTVTADGYTTIKMIKEMLAQAIEERQYAGVKVRVNAVQELPPREEV